MIILDSTSKSLIAKLSGAPATTNPDFACAYATTDGTTFTEGASDGVLNGTSEVTLVAAPGSGYRIIVKDGLITNVDVAAITLIIQAANGASRRTVAKKTLVVNETFSLASFLGNISASMPQPLGISDSPTFAGLTIDALAGLLKGVAGVVGVAVAGTDYLDFSGLAKISVGTDEPSTPTTGDLWVDTN